MKCLNAQFQLIFITLFIFNIYWTCQRKLYISFPRSFTNFGNKCSEENYGGTLPSSQEIPIQRFQVQNYYMATRLTDASICIPGALENLVAKRKLSPCSGSVDFRKLNSIHIKGLTSFSLLSVCIFVIKHTTNENPINMKLKSLKQKWRLLRYWSTCCQIIICVWFLFLKIPIKAISWPKIFNK